VEAEQHLLILGASARAAAFSAARAGLRPWCADLFADRDLQALCPVRAVPAGLYPNGFLRVLDEAPPGPWLYTGGLENRPGLVRTLARARPLWGNNAVVLARARSPQYLAALLEHAGLSCPAVGLCPEELSPDRRWLVKPRAGAGGTGIRFVAGPDVGQASCLPAPRDYYQEYIEGESFSALYLGDGSGAHFLGMTRQLVGEPWLHAAAFHYCGNVGPLAPSPSLGRELEELGKVLVRGCGLRGLFGVDFILREQRPWLVEVNPRYTASVEVLEYGLGWPALAFHRRAFEPTPAALPPLRRSSPGGVIGKAILFAREALTFPSDGPWSATLQRPPALAELPAFADIPPAGQAVPARRPILSCFVRAPSTDACYDALQQMTGDLDRWLFGA
jgi:predicted ATP-grasp superfamily ATP-dependent carboligase